MKKYKILAVALAVLFMYSCGTSTKKTRIESPNIIFILTDDQGWTHTSHRADPNIPESKSDFYETPNIDRLAKTGILFSQGYAPNPICAPSRNSLMFGQNAARHIYNKDSVWYRSTQDWLTIPKAIKNANPNYRTAHFGKWHIAMLPERAGFDISDGMTSNAGGEIYGDGFLKAREYTKATKEYLVQNQIENPTKMLEAGKPSAHWDDQNPKDIFGITQRATDFMKESIKEGMPFYVQLSHYAAHLSLVSKKETYDYFKNKENGERHTNPEFAAMLKDMDTGIGMILDFVKEQGIEDNTYIFLMGDNGGRRRLNQIAVIDENKQLKEARYSLQHDRNLPLRDGKHSFYEGGLRVPFIAKGPNLKSNQVCEVPVTGLDFLPTFAQLAGSDLNFPDEIDGGSLIPLLLDNNQDRVERNSEYLIFHQASHRKPRSAIRKGDFKLVKYWGKETKYENTPKVELFNIREDLSETNNILNKYPEIATELENELKRFLANVNAETGVRDIKGPQDRLMKEEGLKE
ncbi:sulfatase [Marinifilum caeruleilacunae]|uniref:DUF4976 domain-containing protein n=1 Tax=Marinifilum caeruleilacunae TaxID=2499076 RepID=A0ABX1WYS7_9BACT|nr:sulfatase [Marinifilum caeruleilacunae]NOU61303.1 DUF4976 domain-containing protein [Marinifilum caeruleilacunae]